MHMGQSSVEMLAVTVLQLQLLRIDSEWPHHIIQKNKALIHMWPGEPVYNPMRARIVSEFVCLFSHRNADEFTRRPPDYSSNLCLPKTSAI